MIYFQNCSCSKIMIQWLQRSPINPSLLLRVALTNGCTFSFKFYTDCLCQTSQSLLNTLNPLNPPCYLLSTDKDACSVWAYMYVHFFINIVCNTSVLSTLTIWSTWSFFSENSEISHWVLTVRDCWTLQITWSLGSSLYLYSIALVIASTFLEIYSQINIKNVSHKGMSSRQP